MNKLMIAVYIALLICPFIAIAATGPFVILQYKKSRIINVIRCANFYLMIFFTLCAYFMTMLPFPDVADVAKMDGPCVQLIPFYCIYDFIENSGLVISDWTTVIPAVKSGILLGIVFNILMLMPSGFFLKRLYKLKTYELFIIGFLISLIFEFTQLSSLFGIYPRPYRIFDVDDLIQNTAGFMIGAYLTKVWRLFKSPSHIVVRQGGEVSFRRRFLADLIDQSILNGIIIAIVIITKKNIVFFAIHPLKSFPLYFILILAMNIGLAVVTYLFDGKTLGMHIMGLRLKASFGNRLKFSQCITRDIVYAFYINLPLIIGWAITLSKDRNIILSILIILFSAELVFSYVCFNLELALHIVTHGEKLLYEKISNTHLGLESETVIWNRQKVLYRGKLLPEELEEGTGSIYSLLRVNDVDEEDCIRIQNIAEDALVTWMENGLRGHVFTVQIDKRLSKDTLLMCVHGKYVPVESDANSLLDILTGDSIVYDTYYTGGINVFAVEI